MLFFGIKNGWFKAGVFLILTIWASAFAAWMYSDYFINDPYNPQLTGTARYGHNGEGDFRTFSIFLAVEYLILLAVLLPFSFSRFYWLRTLVLQIVFGGWLLLLALGMMHSGGVYTIHALAVFAVNVIIFLLLVAAIIAESVNRRTV